MAQVFARSDKAEEAPRPCVMLDEMQAHMHLGEEGGGGALKKMWYLDSSNHMVGDRDSFSELDTGVIGMMKCGDGSRMGIQRHGTVVFKCLNGEHRALTTCTTSRS